MNNDQDLLAFDTHCHLDLYQDPRAVLDAARRSRVSLVALSNRPSQYRSIKERFGNFPELRLGLGFHPELAGSYDEPHELVILRDHFKETRWIAEIGLDGEFTGVPTFPKQKRVFEEILSYGVSDKILSVHSKAAQQQVIDILKGAGAKAVILHWYSGTLDVARQALDSGFFFSINSAMLQSQKDREFIAWLPEDHLLFETDGPFVIFNQTPVEPVHILEFGQIIADIRGIALPQLLSQSMSNFNRLESIALNA